MWGQQPQLSKTFRWDAFQFLAGELLKKANPILVLETGCLREAGNWEGDGQSTLVWDWLIDQIGGRGYSVDNDLKAVRVAIRHCRRMKIVWDDSLQYLRNFKRAAEIDLLYLDSYDFNGPLSPLHIVGELACIFDRLKPGCLIAVDDCFGPGRGKQALVEAFFQMVQMEPVHQSLITVWKKKLPPSNCSL